MESAVKQIPDTPVRGRIFAIRLSQAEREGLAAVAAEQGVHPSKIVRKLVLDLIARANADGPRPLRTWAAEWKLLEKMEPGEASARFSELAAGRRPPSGFAGWSVARRVAWLTKEWPLCG